MEKVAAHDKWVCIGCRWTAKIEFVDARTPNRPSYRCPKCRTKMLWAGTAFRPPRKSDDEGWLVVEQLLGSGFRYVTTSRRRRVPRTLKELEAWRKTVEAPLGWAAECQVRMPRGASSARVRCGQHALCDGQVVLVWHNGKWREARIDISSRGRVVQVMRPHAAIALTTGLRLRLRMDAARPPQK